MRKIFKNKSFSERGQVAVEYAMVMIVMAIVAAGIFVFYEGLTDQTFYGSFTEVRTIGFERAVSLPFP